MKVLKFGGSSVGSSACIKRMKRIVEGEQQPCIVVISALKGITNLLSAVYESALRNDIEQCNSIVAQISDTHKTIITTLFSNENTQAQLFEEVDMQLASIQPYISLLAETAGEGIDLLESRDAILSIGELISSQIVCCYLGSDSVWIDARDIIRAEAGRVFADIDVETTNALIRECLGGVKELTVVPGFIAGSSKGATVTLGRGGSDYTASIIAAALKAKMLDIWTDVDGFMTADPKKVDKAYTIPHLTYAEAMELSHFGAKVIYPPTLRPVLKANIPVRVKNSFNSKGEGTVINNNTKENGRRSHIKGISSIDDVSLITIQGPGMVGISGISARLFGTLAANGISVILITQASSECSISIAVSPTDSEQAAAAILDEFKEEIKENNELKIHVEKDLSIIAIVGEKMKNTPGVSAKLFSSLGKNGINVVAIAQGSSELNISVIIKKKQLRKALNVIHDNFFLSSFMEINLFIIGIGVVGGSLMNQLNTQSEMLFKERNLKVNLLGVAYDKKMLIDKNGISFENYRQLLEEKGKPTDIQQYIDEIKQLNRRNSIFVDCTASSQVAAKYADILSGYISVVVANKIACSSDYEYYKLLKQTAHEKSVKFMYETTVGAGLPIIRTIEDLILSGDRIVKIEAVLSGTLNFIFNELSADMPMSKTIRKARELGYSEPDPRIDLSGTDVIRKILILAREAGYTLEKSDVEVNNFLPADCFDGSLDDFYAKVEKLDADFEERRKALAAQGKRWRFLATLDEGKARIGLDEIDSDHPAFNLAGSNNIIIITTERYKELPMVIKGYGAGAAVTSAGVFADIMRVVNV